MIPIPNEPLVFVLRDIQNTARKRVWINDYGDKIDEHNDGKCTVHTKKKEILVKNFDTAVDTIQKFNRYPDPIIFENDTGGRY